eukprot:GHVR01136104.1.p1 GENE.GHVR01136104.1~~GHVR01136104.1.p1  ORF type:complete len:334 (+),score=41.82 GHVR01136104.1:87-1088(+)
MRVPNSSSILLASLALSSSSLGVAGAPTTGTVVFRDNAVLSRAWDAHPHDPRDGLLQSLGALLEGLPVVGPILKPLCISLGLYEIPATASNIASPEFKAAVAQLTNSLPPNVTGTLSGLPVPVTIPPLPAAIPDVGGLTKGLTGALPALPVRFFVDAVAPSRKSSSSWSSTSTSASATSTMQAAEVDSNASSTSSTMSSAASPSGPSAPKLPIPLPSVPALPLPKLPVRQAPAPPAGPPAPPAPPGGAPAPPGGAPAPPAGPAPPALPVPVPVTVPGLPGPPAPPTGATSSQPKSSKNEKAAEAPEPNASSPPYPKPTTSTPSAGAMAPSSSA